MNTFAQHRRGWRHFSKAILVLGLDNNLLEAATQANSLQKRRGEWRSKDCPAATEKRHLCRSIDTICAFVYDKKQLKNRQPEKNWSRAIKMAGDLSGPAYLLRGAGAVTVDARKVYGDNAPQAAETGGQNGDGDEEGWSGPTVLFLKGESDLWCSSYTTSPAYHIIEGRMRELQRAITYTGKSRRVPSFSKQPELAEKFPTQIYALRRFRTPYHRQLDIAGSGRRLTRRV